MHLLLNHGIIEQLHRHAREYMHTWRRSRSSFSLNPRQFHQEHICIPDSMRAQFTAVAAYDQKEEDKGLNHKAVS